MPESGREQVEATDNGVLKYGDVELYGVLLVITSASR
jgi:hypothetical protein